MVQACKILKISSNIVSTSYATCTYFLNKIVSFFIFERQVVGY